MATTTSLLSTLLHPPLPAFSPKNSPPAVVHLPGRPVVAPVGASSRGYNVQIMVDENEGEESIFRRFRREVMKAGVLQEVKRRRQYENKQDERKRKAREAGRRNRRRRMLAEPRITEDADDADARRRARDEDEDNWEIPENGLY